MFGLLADQGVGSIPWSPLAQGSSLGHGAIRPLTGARGAWTASAVPSGSTVTRPSSTPSNASRKHAVCRWLRLRWRGC
jgi:aryl-alcohol dehydrogenase-like predicted oxidoreductase